MGKVISEREWYDLLPEKDYADYLMAARDRLAKQEAATVRQVKAVYTRVAKQLRAEIQQITPGALRAGHLTALAKKLELAADELNKSILDAVYAGIRLAATQATTGVQQIVLDVSKDVFDAAAVRAMFAAINEQAVVAVLSRTRHDGLKVSDRIWRVSQNARNALTKIVEDGVTRGLNSRILARQVQQYLQPGVWTALKDETRRNLGVPRDVSMEAMRLAVTELHHAFHEGAVLSYRATPGYDGVYWRLSANHPHPDICDRYASHGGNGFWKAGDEPSKPHPWCRCTVVPRLEDTDQFVQRLRQWVQDPQSQPDIESWYSYLPRSFLKRPIPTAQLASPTVPNQKPLVQKYNLDVQDRLARGIHTVDDVLAVGHILRQEIDRRLSEFKTEIDKLLNHQETVREVLNSVRKMNDNTEIAIHPDSDPDAVRWIKGQLRYLPQDWVDVFRDWKLHAKINPERAYYSDSPSNETISLRAVDSYSVVLHELTHRCESWLPKLVQTEQEFYEYRTKGEALVSLGEPYRPDELARFDRFTDPYMGKDYGGSAYELMSMGMEMVFFRRYKPELDNEYVSWVLGVLAAV